MNKYEVNGTAQIRWTFTVTADSPDTAEIFAEARLDSRLSGSDNITLESYQVEEIEPE